MGKIYQAVQLITNPNSINKFPLFPALHGRGQVLQCPLVTNPDSSAIFSANILPSGFVPLIWRAKVHHIRSK